jgi:hypothetical protein
MLGWRIAACMHKHTGTGADAVHGPAETCWLCCDGQVASTTNVQPPVGAETPCLLLCTTCMLRQLPFSCLSHTSSCHDMPPEDLPHTSHFAVVLSICMCSLATCCPCIHVQLIGVGLFQFTLPHAGTFCWVAVPSITLLSPLCRHSTTRVRSALTAQKGTSSRAYAACAACCTGKCQGK